MPVYNGSRYLRESIDSVLKQSFKDFIFLIIDDCSSDDSVEVINSFSDSRIVLYKNEKNLGSVATPQKAMDLATTEYIARIDQDDIWKHDKLQKQIKIMDENPSVGICGTSIELFGEQTGVKIFPLENNALKVGLLFFCCMSHPSVVFRRSFLTENNIRYNEKYWLVDDYWLWVHCIDKTCFYVIPEPLVLYRQHDTQICSVHDKEQKELQIDVQCILLKRIGEFSDDEYMFLKTKFLTGHISSSAECQKFMDMYERICEENMKTQYIDQSILKKELFRYVQIFIKRYIIEEYFANSFNLHSYYMFVKSEDSKYLTLKRKINLLKNCL